MFFSESIFLVVVTRRNIVFEEKPKHGCTMFILTIFRRTIYTAILYIHYNPQFRVIYSPPVTRLLYTAAAAAAWALCKFHARNNFGGLGFDEIRSRRIAIDTYTERDEIAPAERWKRRNRG